MNRQFFKEEVEGMGCVNLDGQGITYLLDYLKGKQPQHMFPET